MHRVPHALILLLCVGVLSATAKAEVYNLHLVTDSVPDYTDIQSLVRSSTAAWQTPQEKAIAVWRWGRRSRRQTELRRRGRPVHPRPDPALQLLRGHELRDHLLSERHLVGQPRLPRPLHPIGRPHRQRGLLGRRAGTIRRMVLARLRLLDERLLLQPRRGRGEAAPKSSSRTPANSPAARASRDTTISTTSPRNVGRIPGRRAGGARATIRSGTGGRWRPGRRRTWAISPWTAIARWPGMANATC